MPVVTIAIDRLKKLIPSLTIDRILEMLPYAALDIEGIENDIIRVEYNPNRPDFSSEYGIVRAIRGLLGLQTGIPKFKLSGKSGLAIRVGKKVKPVRPFIGALVATDAVLDDEGIRQIIAMQEDLHNGIGRRRKKASIGIHNLDAIRPPVAYTAVKPDFAFVPLGDSSIRKMTQILEQSEGGRAYGHLLQNSKAYPVIVDSAGIVLSFPPIVNGSTTRIDEYTRNILIEVTGTDHKVVEDVLAVLAITLYDAGFKISTVTILDASLGQRRVETPQMDPIEVEADINYINSILGLGLDERKAVQCLRKSRLDARTKGGRLVCTVPRYRTDISDPIDIAEEVAIGYGIHRIEPTFPPSYTVGKKNILSNYFAPLRETLIGLGMIESLGFSLVAGQSHYQAFGTNPEDGLSVEASKSIEHEVLRDSIIPSLLLSLSRNVHEEYPQRLFEIGKTFHKGAGRIDERWRVAAVEAHAQAGFTEAKSSLQGLLKSCFGRNLVTKPARRPFFIGGRSADVLVDNRVVGTIGEVIPNVLHDLKLRTPVAAFEVDLTRLLDLA